MRELAPLVTRVRSFTVAKVDSIGLVDRIYFPMRCREGEVSQ